MKNVKFSLSGIILVIILSFFSCTETDNDSDDIQRFVGTWTVDEQEARLNYQISIIRNPSNSAEILIKNYANLGLSAKALIVGSSAVIDQQSLGSGYSTSGSGSLLNSKKLVINFALDDGIDKKDYVATCTR